MQKAADAAVAADATPPIREIQYMMTEAETGIIHEIQFFDTFVLARPISPSLYRKIRRVENNDFYREFREFCGDQDAVRKSVDFDPNVMVIN